MEPHVLGAVLYWLLLPCALLAACLLRFSGLSLVYLLFLLLLPWFPGPTRHSLQGHTGRLLRALLGLSLLFLVAHLALQICLHTVPHLDQLLGPSCSRWETLSRHIGVTRLDLKDIPNAIRLVAPDLGILVVSSVCLGLCGRLARNTQQSPHTQELDDDERDVDTSPPAGLQEAATLAPTRRSRLAARFRITAHWLLVAAGRVLAVTLLALAGIAHPSALSSVYLLVFLAICTWWACHFPISTLGFNRLCVAVGCFSTGHLLSLYCYQTPLAQALLPPADIWARVLGLKDFVGPANCSSPHVLVLNTSLDWPMYASPGVLLLLCYATASLRKLRVHRPSGQRKEAAKGDETRELELAELDQWPQDGEAAQHVVPTAPDTEADNCIVHELTGQSPIRQRPVWPKRAEPREASPLHSLGHLIMDQSYVCALIAMMVWSITYHSWLTFVLLLWACLIWTVRSRHQLAMLCSPCILLYGMTLCCLRYVWAMDLRPELPTTLGPVSLRQLGLEHTRYPCLDLGAMLLYTLTFWLLLRQFVKEKLLKRAEAPAALTEVTVADTEPTRTQTLLQSLGELVKSVYAKYWIYVCAGMFIVVSFAGRLVVYKIVYMFLFLLCLTLFQVYYSLWRKLLKAFWWLVVAYTMLVLIAVYTFQFQDFPAYWRNLTGFTDEQLGDLGLEQFSVSELFSSILVPGFFLLACILQLHYFHRPFMQLTDMEHVSPPGRRLPRWAHRQDAVSGTPLLQQEQQEEEEEEGPRDEGLGMATPHQATQVPEGAAKWGLVAERLLELAAGFSDVLSRVQVFLRRLLELHVFKLVALYTVWVALKEVSVMNLLLVVLWAFALPYPRFRPMASCLSTVWTCVIIVCKMLYQLKVVNPQEYSSNCTEPSPNSTNLLTTEISQSLLYQGPVDPANWFGVRKGFPNLGYIQNHLQVLLLLVFEAIVYRRQEHHRRQHQLAPLPAQAVFASGTRQQLDQDLLGCLKYFINFFFYKFGLEGPARLPPASCGVDKKQGAEVDSLYSGECGHVTCRKGRAECMTCVVPLQKYPQPKGQKKKKIVKYGMGGLIILFLIAIIWFPLLFMSLVRSVVGVVNQPVDVTVTLKLGGYEPLFTMSAQQPSIIPFTAQAYEELSRQFDPHPLAMQFISQYSPEDIVTAQIEGSSGALWRISPPSRAQMKRELYNGTADITLRFTWNFQRDLAKGGTVEYANEKHMLALAPNSTARRQLASLLEGTSDQSVVIPNLFPKYIRAPNGPEANPVKQLQPNEEADYLGVRIQLRREQGAGATGFLEWWVIELQECRTDCNLLPMVIFSDKVSPPSLGFLAGYGIMGLYVSIVLVIGKFVRGFFSEISHSIMFEELPCVDRILKLCQDIFLVRETRELELEEELYAKLIFLYRSPETMIKWTREKE
ncbi:piezo-type mechanosensitive ion channel component 1 [Theropithecus gelada]|uniref:piezo-type mechanosensitive ion channel component 1 n=1 Tax=Theropithecus gelada TaxID=9565 RepID=UPI000DC174E3|nr:piezo-type mechanosensitive ion channel component 1 [Theropithecus gelada]